MRVLYAATVCLCGDESTGASRQHPTRTDSFVNPGEQTNLNLLALHADNLDRHTEPATLVVCVNNMTDLIDKARYYVDHEEDRARITETARLRNLPDRTCEHGFNDILARIGLQTKLEAQNW